MKFPESRFLGSFTDHFDGLPTMRPSDLASDSTVSVRPITQLTFDGCFVPLCPPHGALENYLEWGINPALNSPRIEGEGLRSQRRFESQGHKGWVEALSVAFDLRAMSKKFLLRASSCSCCNRFRPAGRLPDWTSKSPRSRRASYSNPRYP
jgi:hypothetical protein